MAIAYEDGTEAEAQDSAEVGGFKEPIPHDTTLLCRVLGVMWKEGKVYQNGGQADDTLNIDLEVTEAGKYKGRIETHKLKMWDTGSIYGGGTDEEKAAKNRKKAIDFLIVYDTIAGGKIRKHKKQWHEIITEMTDMLADTEVLIKFGCTDAMSTFNPATDRANQYIQAVSRPLSAAKAAPMPPRPAARPATRPAPAAQVNDDFDPDSIPF
jgi:hypothetical protein